MKIILLVMLLAFCDASWLGRFFHSPPPPSNDDNLTEYADIPDIINSKHYTQPPVIDKKFFLVMGPESSGNRYCVKLIIDGAQCYGQAGHYQPYDIRKNHKQMTAMQWSEIDFKKLKESQKQCGVMHRSIPHDGKYVNITHMVAQIRSQGMTPHILITLRSEPHMILSQIRNQHTSNIHQSEVNIEEGFKHLFNYLYNSSTPFDFVFYDLMDQSYYIQWLFKKIGAEYHPQSIPPFQTQNPKYDLAPVFVNPPIELVQSSNIMQRRRNYQREPQRHL
jgi:hypothetical protein